MRTPLLAALLAAACLAAGARAAAATMPQVCTEEPGCKCNRTAQGYWVTVSCACPATQDLLELKPEQLPAELVNLEISRCKEVRLLHGSLSQQKALRKIHAHGISSLTLKKNSFLNSSATNAFFHIENCSTVVIESSAYKNMNSPQSILLENSKHVIIQPSAFSWIQDFNFKSVSRLELHKNAFSQSGVAVGHHGPASKVLIEDSIIPEIPGLAFPLSASNLRIQRSSISVIRKDAFCGLLVLNLSLEQCRLDTVERGAFSARTQVHRLTLSNLTAETVASNAVQSAVTNFTLQHSKLKEVFEGGINVTAASVVLFSNTVQRLHSKGLAFSQWDRLEVQGNVFKDVGFSGVWAPTERSAGSVVFSENVIGRMAAERGSLYFGISPRTGDVQVLDNRFEQQCSCSARDWLREEASPRLGEALTADYAHRSTDFWVDAFHNTSYCIVSDLLAKCFGSNTTMGFMRMTGFWDSVCSARTVIRCQNGDVVEIPDDPLRPTILKDPSKVAYIMMAFVTISIMTIVVVNAALRCYRRYPDNRLSVAKVLPCLKRTEVHETETPTLPIGTVVSTSIDLLPGPRRQKKKKRHKRRNVGVTASEDNTLIHDDVAPGSTNASEAGTVRTQASTMESTILVVDSGTQTMGSGTLVDDILSDLKEKLRDPQAYGETREMIENIYNQINTESNLRTPRPPDENTYAEIQPCTSSYQSPALCEYGEPQDRRTNIYTEPQSRFGRLYQFITGHAQNNDVEARPPTTVTEYLEPSDTRLHVYTELQQPSRMANRPLPRTPEERSSDDGESETEESS